MKPFCKVEPNRYNEVFVSPLSRKQKDYLYSLVAKHLDQFNLTEIKKSIKLESKFNDTDYIIFKFYHKRMGTYPIQVHDTIITIRIGADYIDILANKSLLSVLVRKTKIKELLQNEL